MTAAQPTAHLQPSTAAPAVFVEPASTLALVRTAETPTIEDRFNAVDRRFDAVDERLDRLAAASEDFGRALVRLERAARVVLEDIQAVKDRLYDRDGAEVTQ